MKRLETKDNPALGRKEVTYLFEESAGLLTRTQAQKMVAADLSTAEELVVPMSLRCGHGSKDFVGRFYVYPDAKTARSQLPKFVFARNLAKEDRKKLLDEMKKNKAPKVAAQKK